ncbi:MAG: phosphate/phosphite/phosphonate ABC transporter substrate-binding protein [Fimbriiglobus sp.]
MRRSWAAVLGVVMLGGGGTATAAEPPTGLKIGMVQGMFKDVQPAMVLAMSKPLRDLMSRQTGLEGHVDIVPDAFALADRMTGKQLQLGVFHGFEFAWVAKNHPDIVPLLVTVPAGRKVAASIVVRKDSTARALTDLTDETVRIPRGAKAHTLLFLERERAKVGPTVAKPKTDLGMTSEDVLDSVITGDSAAALVDAAALAGYQSLQPGAFKHLRVLLQSEPFPPAVIAYRKDLLDEATAGKIKSGMTQAHQMIVGKPLLALWNLRGFEEIPADYAAQLEAVRRAYPAPAGK